MLIATAEFWLSAVSPGFQLPLPPAPRPPFWDRNNNEVEPQRGFSPWLSEVEKEEKKKMEKQQKKNQGSFLVTF